jgi:hypothetical protein
MPSDEGSMTSGDDGQGTADMGLHNFSSLLLKIRVDILIGNVW